MIPAIVDHLWQSTLFAGVAAMLTLALRSNRARVRHAVWLAASLKFLIPFSLFVTLGSQIQWRKAEVAAPSSFAIAMDQMGEPFTALALPPPLVAAPEQSSIPWFSILLAIWACGFLAISATWLTRWLRIRSAVRAGSPVLLDIPVRALSSPTLLEPGVFGVFRPTLLIPSGIVERLTPAQLESVIEHELCHVRHHDNLTAMMQMLVETLFWFHALVWWIGKRMVAERERACDEAVLETGSQPTVYAEAILNVCKLYVESPLPCVAGITGAGLKQRIENIVRSRTGVRLTRARRILLVIAAVAAVATPVFIGTMTAPAIGAQGTTNPASRFEVASIKQNLSGRGGTDGFEIAHGRLTVRNVSLKTLIEAAYQIEGPRITGGPAWMNADRFDVIASGPASASRQQVWLMLRELLAQRFGVKLRRETKELPIYQLEVAKGGPKMTKEGDGECGEAEANLDLSSREFKAPCGGVLRARGPQGEVMVGTRLPISKVAQTLAAIADRPVVDHTGLKGAFNVDLRFTPDNYRFEPGPGGERPHVDNAEPAPSLFTAVQEQLGLRLTAARGPVEVLIIESVARPTDNFTEPQAEERLAPKFEVASIKPCTPDHGQTIFGSTSTGPGRLSTGCALLAVEGEHTGLIQRAYVRYAGGRFHPLGPHGLIPIEGAPAWLHSEFFAIEAKAASPESPEMMQGPMMQRLLEERFKLKLHRETREGPVYNLTVAKSKLRPFKDGSCTNMPVPGMPRVELKQRDHFCKFSIDAVTGSIDAEGSTVGEFISLLMLAVDRQVVDKTGLGGRFDIHIDFTPLQKDAADPSAEHPSIFTAVQAQLGLKLESGRGPNEFLVIDHVERPTEN